MYILERKTWLKIKIGREMKMKYLKNSDIESTLIRGKYSEREYKYSIVIPTYKRPELLRETLKSVVGIECSQPYEIIVVDNEANEGVSAFTDTEKVVAEFEYEGLVYFRNEKNLGMVGNWNRGIELARGKYVTILHDDDWVEPDFLIEVEKRINGSELLLFRPRIRDFSQKQTPSAEMKRGIKSAIRNLADSIIVKRKLSITDFYLRNPAFGTLGIVFDKQKMLEIGCFDEELYPIMDYITWMKYCKQEGAVLYTKKVTNYRVEDNVSFQSAKITPQKLQEFREEFYKENSSTLERVHKFSRELYVNDIIRNEKAWRVEIEKPDFFETTVNGFRYKMFVIWLNLYLLCRM